LEPAGIGRIQLGVKPGALGEFVVLGLGAGEGGEGEQGQGKGEERKNPKSEGIPKS
jgi:hypothetical protein